MTWQRGGLLDLKTDVRLVSKQEILDRNLYPCVDCGELVRNVIGKVRGASWEGNLLRQDVPVIRPGSQIFHYVHRQVMEAPGREIYWGRFRGPEYEVGYRFTRCRRFFLANQTWSLTSE